MVTSDSAFVKKERPAAYCAPPSYFSARTAVALPTRIGKLTVVISPHGVELQSSRLGDEEFLWQGNPAV